MVDFLFALFGLFRYLLRFRNYDAKCVQLGCFHRGSTSLHSNFTWTGRLPATIRGIRKLETVGYPTVKTASLCVSSFWYNTGVWRTDGQTDGLICPCILNWACKASFAARCKKKSVVPKTPVMSCFSTVEKISQYVRIVRNKKKQFPPAAEMSRQNSSTDKNDSLAWRPSFRCDCFAFQPATVMLCALAAWAWSKSIFGTHYRDGCDGYRLRLSTTSSISPIRSNAL